VSRASRRATFSGVAMRAALASTPTKARVLRCALTGCGVTAGRVSVGITTAAGTATLRASRIPSGRRGALTAERPPEPVVHRAWAREGSGNRAIGQEQDGTDGLWIGIGGRPPDLSQPSVLLSQPTIAGDEFFGGAAEVTVRCPR
jgi:hypothetical protein